MFIPNKTYNAITVGVVGVIAALLIIIVAESVLYMKLSREQEIKLQQLSAQVDSLSLITMVIDKNAVRRDTHAQTELSTVTSDVGELQTAVETARRTIQILVDNECIARQYYLDKRLFEMCPKQ